MRAPKTTFLAGAFLVALPVAAAGASCTILLGADKSWHEVGTGGTGGQTGTGGAGTSSGASMAGSTSTGGSSTSASTGTGASGGASCAGATIAGQGLKVFNPGSAGVVSVAVDAQSVFWTLGATPTEPALVGRHDKVGTQASSFAPPSQSLARALVADDTNLYWITTPTANGTGDAIWKITKTFGSAGTMLVSSNGGGYGGLAADQGLVYFTSITPPALFYVAIAGGTPVQLVSFSSSDTPAEVVSDGAALYVVVGTSFSLSDIYRFDLIAKNLATFVMGESGVHGLLFDAQYVYWSAIAGLRRASKTGGMPQTIASTPCDGMSLDATYLYCTDSAGGAVHQILLSDPTKVFTATAVGTLRGIAADCSDVYFGSDMSLDRIPKH
jgi:hypothetical protein